MPALHLRSRAASARAPQVATLGATAYDLRRMSYAAGITRKQPQQASQLYERLESLVQQGRRAGEADADLEAELAESEGAGDATGGHGMGSPLRQLAVGERVGDGR